MQPSFYCVANIGDATPFVHGGAFVMVDLRGNYDPELLILEPSGSDRYGDPTEWRLFTVVCETLTAIKNADGCYAALSDNCYHTDKPAWWADPGSLQSFADSLGETVEDTVKRAVSKNCVERASVYRDLVGHVSIDNFDSEPRQLDRKQAKAFCAAMREQVTESAAWHDGYGFSFA